MMSWKPPHHPTSNLPRSAPRRGRPLRQQILTAHHGRAGVPDARHVVDQRLVDLLVGLVGPDEIRATCGGLLTVFLQLQSPLFFGVPMFF